MGIFFLLLLVAAFRLSFYLNGSHFRSNDI